MANILVVDDEPEILVLTKVMLEKAGHIVDVANNSKECLLKIKKEKPDLILMDVMMPDDSGWDTCKTIKEAPETDDVIIIMFTVRVSDDSIEKSYQYAHADGHINKPFERMDLIDTVKNLLIKAGKT